MDLTVTILKRYAWMAIGIVSLGLGLIGIWLPLLPTTPWVLLAAFCFAKAEPRWEKRLLDHPKLGPMILAWRDRQAIPWFGKVPALAMLAVSAVVGWKTLDPRVAWLPTLVALLVGPWIWTRPSR